MSKSITIREGVYEGVVGTIIAVDEDLPHHVLVEADHPGLDRPITVNIKHIEVPDEA